MSRAGKTVVILLAAMIVVTGGALAYGAWLITGVPGEGEEVTIEVSGGATATTVGAQLQAERVVRSALAFRLKARSRGLDRLLQAGAYAMETGMSVDEAIDRLLDGPARPVGIRFTVAEGLTIEETLQRLADQTPYTVAEYRAVLDARNLRLPEWVPSFDTFGAGVREPYEGLLFPETYEVGERADAAAILQRLLDQTANEVAGVDEQHVAAAAAAGFDPYEVLVIASLVEEEAKIATERPLIASVIYNRLADDMALQVDASNLYGAGRPDGAFPRTCEELDSPYNLYCYPGLPPTPIAGSGRSAIQAAFDPDETGFLYYVKIDAEGHHAFAETFEEHLQNDALYDEPAPTS